MSHEHLADEFSFILIKFSLRLYQFSFDVPHGTVKSAYASTKPDKLSERKINKRIHREY